MSSILDALKKAERESTVDNGKGTPWPALPADSAVDAKSRGRLWIFLGAVGVFGVIVSVYWFTRRPEPVSQPVVARRAVEPVATEKPRSAILPAPTNRPPIRHSVPDVPSPLPPARSAQNNLAAKPPVSPAKKPLPHPKPKPDKRPDTTPQPVPEPPVEPARQPMEAQRPPQPFEDTQQNGPKNVRNDARIDLQALVWAPDAADRFVLINNHMLREGGSFDKITVVRINPDDVLLSEGAERWYQEFKVR